MIKRDAETKLKEFAAKYPVVMVTGPRQSGKTTLCKKVFPDKPYVLLEDPDTRDFAINDPRGFLEAYPKGAIFDEVQKAPMLLSYLQGIVDSQKKKGLYIVTGSQNLMLLRNIQQSLAGRAAILKLLPFSIHEIKQKIVRKNLNEVLLTGFYPRIHDEVLDPTEALSLYFQTYIERDIHELIHLKDVLKFQRFVKLCAGRVGQLLNLSSLGNEAGVTHQTASDWINLLEMTYILYRLPPYYKNYNKRIIKSPKIYFCDVGLAAYLLEIENEKQMDRDPLRGNLFENMVITEFLKGRYNKGRDSNLYFFRDNKKNEVDLIVKGEEGLIVVEVKSAQTIAQDFFKGINYFSNVSKDSIQDNYLIYAGEKEQKRQTVKIINYKNLDRCF
ncbi:MAG: ATP-binding protein [Candidatus Omnitrophota bacterium]